MTERIDTVILGATGYVAGELLRLLAFHPRLNVRAAVSRSRVGSPIQSVFPHLAGVHPGLSFSGADALTEVLAARGPVALFSALPHGEAAHELDRLLRAAEEVQLPLVVVDLSADYRLPSAAAYEAVYGRAHGAPARLERFHCGLPDLESENPGMPIAHPGCFTTAVTLACAPIHALMIAEPAFFVAAVTGSTGSGREPTATTHHPERHGNLRAYQPLKHRHEIEMRNLISRAAPGAPPPEIAFVPHSGPFARGILATIHVRLRHESTSERLAALIGERYAGSPFVEVRTSPPALKEVVGTNRCCIGVEVRGRDAVLFSVIDNLTKGAAGGGIQWMNRALGFEESLGLLLPGLGWN